ncbi:U-box domain-containing protein 9 [Hordeum vulgare]|uniref:RING-type E3 ubiquitin transferase n=1 Tax=Hordeum vulgare subsp. vulgare TaxID=112509 RepID=A0A8I7B2Z8_HORVV|nr:U-box domain-containing protein 18-like [Hordeum vulgare subsp. vulgare]KAE8806932.1 U-box domain-containing protein 9 [Hordeum vulgare]
MDGIQDWTEKGIKEEEEPGLRRRGRTARAQSPSADHGPLKFFGARSRSSSPLPGAGSRPVPHSVRTRRSASARVTVVPAAADGAGSGGAGGSGGSFDWDLGAMEETVSSMRDQRARPRLVPPPDTSTSSASITGGRAQEVAVEREFSFPPLEAPPKVVDAAEVLGQFAAQFLEATMGATAGPRTEKIKKELLLDRKVVDLVGLERWLRKMEAVAELAWFTDLCSHEEKEVPPLELFECAFRALEAARSDELHRCSADARRLWIGPVAVPKFFLSPFSKKFMEKPVVITSGKTVDQSELEKWWKKNKRMCPVTGEVLTHSIFIPDVLIALCISRWRAANRISELTAPTALPPAAISPEEEALFKEVTLLANSPMSSKQDYEALLRLLADQQQCSFLHLLGRSPGTITKLACVLPETCLEPHPELDDVVLEILAMAASYSPNKEVFGDDRYAIPVLIARALLGPVPTRAKCARILGLLADNYYNKIKIGELGGFAPLMELLLVGDVDVKKTVAVALASLCEAHENWSRFVREGVADAAISLLRNHRLVDEAHRILLQAEGFQLAMQEIIDKLESFRGHVDGDGDEMCKEMVDRLWRSFIGSSPAGRRRRPDNFPPEASSSSSSSSEEDVEAIVSWLQRKSCNPRTYRCRDYH